MGFRKRISSYLPEHVKVNCYFKQFIIHQITIFVLNLSEKAYKSISEAGRDHPIYQFYGNYEKGQALTFLNNSEEALTFFTETVSRIAS
jgi:hypothetical protein